jgi:hygromycin-B 4-O-kinase
VDLDVAAASALLSELSGEPIVAVPAGAGMWSRCFTFDRGRDRLVARFGRHRSDFESDRLAAGFARSGLPIPWVHEIGAAFEGHYAISDRADGTPLEEASPEQWRSLVEPLAAALSAMRSVDPPPGWGGWTAEGRGAAGGWRGHLMAVAVDDEDERSHGRLERLEAHQDGAECFRWGLGLLDQVASDDVPRCVVHCDLINRNVHVVGDTITGIFDWGCGRYGDPLYDLAWFDFWSPWHPDLDLAPLFDATDLPTDGDRYLACLLHIGLDHLGYNAIVGDITNLTATARRMRAVVERF